jgi:transcription-repair coupling factor (superfamily II helicase)
VSLLADLADSLGRLDAYASAERRVRADEDVTLAAPGVIRPLLVAALFRERPVPTLVVVSGEEAAERLGRQLRSFLPRDVVLGYPARDVLPWDRHASDVESVGRRARALHALERGTPALVVASARSLLRAVPPHGSQAFDPLVLEHGADLDLTATAETLGRMGYERVDTARSRGEFAVRGGTFDVFPSDAAYPVRVELVGDEVESVRRYVSSTGQVIGDAARTEVYPCREVRLSTRAVRAAERALEPAAADDLLLARDLEFIRERIYFNGIERYLPFFFQSTGAVTDYLGPTSRIAAIEPRALFGDAVRRFEEVREAADDSGVDTTGLFARPGDLELGERPRSTFVSLLASGTGVDGEIEARRPDVSGGETRLAAALGSLARDRRVLFAARDARMRDRLVEMLVQAGVPVAAYDDAQPVLPGSERDEPFGLARGVVTVAVADVPAGFVVERAGLAVVTADDAFPRSPRARTRPDAVDDISFDYAPGDYVVHATHGIALFRDVVRKTILGVERDYLLLEYAGGDRLYVPLEQLDRVGKYVGADSSAPRLTRLDTADWSRALSKTRKAVRTLAFDLVELYARRATADGFAFDPDTPWQREMEAGFPFEETPDQRAAIEAVKSDMESAKPMDRLVAGDVGYGKTEVAVRTAFKAVQSGKQVMVLCPTTVLAQQHYTTFFERFEPFGVEVEVLSRFRTKAQQRDALERFATGSVDVLVGTHRLLSADVVPKDLGLVVIDEEQRFGVAQKEHFTHLREQIDVLTLSATPIPRTMRMALSGVRDLTVIDTPPADRYPVEVHVGEWDEDLVQAAVRAEVERGGQVYYVHNRVQDLDDVVERLAGLVPEVRLGVGHGQMSERELERVMESFAAGEFDVLVSTTIVESGLDNPHTNTLVVDDSQRLGLAQLYQLKGRVGRSHVRARGYFFFPRGSSLTTAAVERLAAVREHAALGEGLKLAMRDLEIRGAGSLLGAEQHGNVGAVGFELFAQMLREAVAQARGEEPPAHPDIRVDLPAAAYLPAEYVPEVDERVRWYRRLGGARTSEALEGTVAELEASAGTLPPQALALVEMMRARSLVARLGAESVALVSGHVTVQPLELDDATRDRLKGEGWSYQEKSRKLSIPLGEESDPADGTVRVLRTLVEELGARESDRLDG